MILHHESANRRMIPVGFPEPAAVVNCVAVNMEGAFILF